MEAEIAKLKRFQDFLRKEDKPVFHDLLDQCKLYAPYAGTMTSPVKEVPFLLSMLFGQHKKIIELEKRILVLETVIGRDQPSGSNLSLHYARPENKPIAQTR